MHQAVLEFLTQVKAKFPNHFVDVKVLELGSLNINGTPRIFFEGCNYVGVDWREGPDVDHVALAHEPIFDVESFDTIVSTEMFEHDPYAEQSFCKAIQLLKKNGLFIFTCANEKRMPHCLDSGFNRHYRGIRKTDVLNWISNVEHSEFHLAEIGEDLQGWIKK